MRKTHTSYADGRRSPERGNRNGSAAAFARAIARAEFGRFYVDEARLREAKGSVEEAIARRKPAPKPTSEPRRPATRDVSDAPEEIAPPAQPVTKKHIAWRMPSVRERRTEIATGIARLRKEGHFRD